MSNQGMRKECKFCGAKFGQNVKLCPNCGSTDIKLVAQENTHMLYGFYQVWQCGCSVVMQY